MLVNYRSPSVVNIFTFDTATLAPRHTSSITMTEDKRPRRDNVPAASLKDLHLGNGDIKQEPGRRRSVEESASSTGFTPKDISMNSISRSPSPIRYEKALESPYTGSEKHEEVIGGDVTVKEEPGQPLKLSRSTSQKVVSRPPTLYNGHPSKTEEARTSFQVIPECTYTSKHIGSTEHDSMDCDCVEEWGKGITYIVHYAGTKRHTNVSS